MAVRSRHWWRRQEKLSRLQSTTVYVRYWEHFEAHLLLLPALALRPHIRCRRNCTWNSEFAALTGIRRRLSSAQTSDWTPEWVFWAKHTRLRLFLAGGTTGTTTYRGSLNIHTEQCQCQCRWWIYMAQNYEESLLRSVCLVPRRAGHAPRTLWYSCMQAPWPEMEISAQLPFYHTALPCGHCLSIATPALQPSAIELFQSLLNSRVAWNSLPQNVMSGPLLLSLTVFRKLISSAVPFQIHSTSCAVTSSFRII